MDSQFEICSSKLTLDCSSLHKGLCFKTSSTGSLHTTRQNLCKVCLVSMLPSILGFVQFRFMCHASQPKLSYPKSRPCLLFWRSVWTYYSLAAVYNSLRTFPKKSPYDFKIAILSDPNLNINSSYYKSRIHLSAIFGLFLQPFNSKAKTSSPHRVLGTVLETFILHSKLAM